MRRISQQEWENEHMHNPMTEGEALAVDVSKMLRGKVRDAAFGIATIEVDCSDLGPNTIGPGHEILIHNLTKNPLTAHTAALREQPEAWGVVECPACGAPADRSEREGVFEMEDVYRYAPSVDDAAVDRAAAAFADAMGFEDKWPDDYSDEQRQDVLTGLRAALTAALTGERNG